MVGDMSVVVEKIKESIKEQKATRCRVAFYCFIYCSLHK